MGVPLQKDFRGCLAIAMTLQEFFRHSDFIDMAGFDDGHRLARPGQRAHDHQRAGPCLPTLQPTFRRHSGRHLRQRARAAAEYPIGGDQPRVNAGTNTYPLDLSAALTADRSALILAVVNPTEQPRPLQIAFEGFSAAGRGRAWKLTGRSLRCTEPRRSGAAGRHCGTRLRRFRAHLANRPDQRGALRVPRGVSLWRSCAACIIRQFIVGEGLRERNAPIGGRSECRSKR